MGQLRIHSYAYFILSGNAEMLEYTADSGEKLYVQHVNTGEVYQLNCLDDGNQHYMDITDILNSIGLITPKPVSNLYANTVAASQVKFYLADYHGNTDTEISKIILAGHLDEHVYNDDAIDNLLQTGYLSQAPQVRKTNQRSIEYLTVMIPDIAESGPMDVIAHVTCYLNDGTEVQKTIDLGNSRDYPIIAARVDASRIKLLLTSAQASRLEAWDVYVSYRAVGHGEYDSVRYILENGRSNDICFAFVNDLGGLDVIHARGTKKITPTYSPSSFVNGKITSTRETSPQTLFEAASGPIASSEERNFWQAFLRSKEKYRLFPDGGYIAINMTEASPELIDGEISSATFKYAESIERGGQVPDYPGLGGYR